MKILTNMVTATGCKKVVIEISSSSIKSITDFEEVDEVSVSEDLSDHVVLPGLVNAHVHLGESAYKNFMSNCTSLSAYLDETEKICKKLSIEDCRGTIGRYSVSKLLCNGNTTIVGGRTRELSNEFGIRNFSGYILMNSDKLGKFSKNIKVDFTEESAKCANDVLCKSLVFIHSINTIDAVILKNVKEVIDDNPLTIHVAEDSESESNVFSRWGKSSVQVLADHGLLRKNTLLVHANCLHADDWRLISDSGATIVHCPSSNMRISDKVCDINKALDNGINVSIGTDGLVTGGTFSLLEEAKIAFLYQSLIGNSNISPKIIFDMITINPANALGLNAGLIDIGKLADLIFVKMGNLAMNFDSFFEDIVFRPNIVDITSVMINGIWKVLNKTQIGFSDKNITDSFGRIN